MTTNIISNIPLIVVITIIFVIILNRLFKLKIMENFFGLSFIHIPKNAGSSIENAGLQKNTLWGYKRWTKKDCNKGDNIFKIKGPWLDKKNNNKTIDNKSPGYPWHRTPDVLGKDVYNNDKLFCVVRNPYSKIVSAYKYHQGKKSSKEGLNSWIKKYLSDYDNNIYFNGCHILEQNNYTHGDIKCDHIIRFENLDKEFNKLMKEYDLNVTLPVSNKSNNNVSVKDLDKESLELIYKVYKKDFDIYNYDKNI